MLRTICFSCFSLLYLIYVTKESICETHIPKLRTEFGEPMPDSHRMIRWETNVTLIFDLVTHKTILLYEGKYLVKFKGIGLNGTEDIGIHFRTSW